MRKAFAFFALLVLFAPVSYARVHMPLLAVRETELGYEGSIAHLYLDIRPGQGRVFIETLPFTKIDTQISTRFAHDIVCDELQIDCSAFDFFYTIKANSTIVGGPSAGSAVAVLTAVALQELEIDPEMAITGTINSGGVIGPVGSIKEKIDAAAMAGIKKVLIPKGQRFLKEMGFTLDLADYADKKGIELIEVSELEEAISLFAQKHYKHENITLNVSPVYTETMSGISELLCSRAMQIMANITDNKSVDFKKGLDFLKKGRNASKQGFYYSAASFCFGACVRFRTLMLTLEKNLSNIVEKLKSSVDKFEAEIEQKNITTMMDLETYMVVKERIKQARRSIRKLNELYEKEFVEELAYAIERLFTAKSWARFFSKGQKKVDFDRAALQNSCLNKLAEAEERRQYAELFAIEPLQSIRQLLSDAYKDSEEGSYELCLFRASKAKAEANAIISASGIDPLNIGIFLESKLDLAKKSISKQQKKENFPLLGYAYFEYATLLKEENPALALIYSDYSLELSNLDMYFKPEKPARIPKLPEAPKEESPIIQFTIGIAVGFAICIALFTAIFLAARLAKTRAATKREKRARKIIKRALKKKI